MMRRGTKRKIPLEKIEKKESRHVAFTKRSKGLYSKASDLCLLSGGQIAILATPVSSNSNVSFYSFGHSSVGSVVSAFLANQRPREDDDQNLGFWWNDEGLAWSENPEELREAMNFMSKMLQHLKDLEKREDVEKKRVLHAPHQNQTLDFQSSSTSSNFDKNSEDQILAISDNNKNRNSGLTANLDGIDANQELSLDQIFDIVESQGPPGNNEELNLDDMSDFEAYVYGGSTKDEDDLHAKRQSSSTSVNFDKNSEEHILASSDKKKNNNSGITENLDGIGANQV